MNITLHDKRAVVTGSTAGIGLAIARGLAAAGAHVVINGRTDARVQAAIADIRATTPDADLSGVAADMATAAGTASLIAQVQRADILVNNVGTGALVPFLELTDDQWTSLFDLNVMSGVCLTRHYLRGWWHKAGVASFSSAANLL